MHSCVQIQGCLPPAPPSPLALLGVLALNLKAGLQPWPLNSCMCVCLRERERENTHKMYHFTILAPAYSSAAVGSIHSIVQPSRLSVADPSPRLGRKPWPHKQSLLFPLPQHRTTQICFLSLWTCLFCISQKWNQTPWGVFPSLSMLLSGSSAQSPSAHSSCLSLVGSLHPWPPLPPGVTHLSSLG